MRPVRENKRRQRCYHRPAGQTCRHGLSYSNVVCLLDSGVECTSCADGPTFSVTAFLRPGNTVPRSRVGGLWLVLKSRAGGISLFFGWVRNTKRRAFTISTKTKLFGAEPRTPVKTPGLRWSVYDSLLLTNPIAPRTLSARQCLCVWFGTRYYGLAPVGGQPSSGSRLRLVLRQINYRQKTFPPCVSNLSSMPFFITNCSTLSSTPISPRRPQFKFATKSRTSDKCSANCVSAGMTRLWSVGSTSSGVALLSALQKVRTV